MYLVGVHINYAAARLNASYFVLQQHPYSTKQGTMIKMS